MPSAITLMPRPWVSRTMACTIERPRPLPDGSVLFSSSAHGVINSALMALGNATVLGVKPLALFFPTRPVDWWAQHGPAVDVLVTWWHGLGWNVARMNLRGAGSGAALCALPYNAGLDSDVIAVLQAVARLTPRLLNCCLCERVGQGEQETLRHGLEEPGGRGGQGVGTYGRRNLCPTCGHRAATPVLRL